MEDSRVDRDVAALTAFLADRDAACPVCSYNLRGLKAALCPECSARLHLQVGSEHLRLGPWFVCVVSLALGLGFDGVVSLMGLGAMAYFRPTVGQAWPMVRALLVLIPLGLACAAGLVLLFRCRRTWARMAPRTQRMVAAAVFAGVGLVHGGAGLYLLTR